MQSMRTQHSGAIETLSNLHQRLMKEVKHIKPRNFFLQPDEWNAELQHRLFGSYIATRPEGLSVTGSIIFIPEVFLHSILMWKNLNVEEPWVVVKVGPSTFFRRSVLIFNCRQVISDRDRILFFELGGHQWCFIRTTFKKAVKFLGFWISTKSKNETMNSDIKLSD